MMFLSKSPCSCIVQIVTISIVSSPISVTKQSRLEANKGSVSTNRPMLVLAMFEDACMIFNLRIDPTLGDGHLKYKCYKRARLNI